MRSCKGFCVILHESGTKDIKLHFCFPFTYKYLHLYLFFTVVVVGDWLSKLMQQSLGIGAEKPEQLLKTVDFEGVADFIKTKKDCKIITMAGAGISTCKFPSNTIFYTLINIYPFVRVYTPYTRVKD